MTGRLFVVSLPVLGLLAGCVSSPRLTADAGNEVIVGDRLPAPEAADVTQLAATRPFALGPLDQVKVQVSGLEALTTETQIDNGGRIQLPLIGSIVAAGKTLDQLTVDLTSAYRRTYVKDPLVSVALVETKSLYITVEGAVRLPGVYPAFGPLRLNGALALAQGANEFAAFDNVAVFRMVDGKQHAAIFNLKDIRRGRYEDPQIFPNDTVIVGESAIRRVFRDIIQTAPFVAVFRPFG